jgi:hypothetical protein
MKTERVKSFKLKYSKENMDEIYWERLEPNIYNR